MKRLLLIAMCCLMLTACAQPAPAPTTTPTAPPETAAPTAPPTEPPTENPTEHNPLTFTVYSGNGNADGFVTTEVEVAVINEETVTQKLIEAGVLPEGTKVNDLSAEGMQLNIDFNAPFRDHLFTMGTAGEMILIGSVVNTFLNAYQAESIFLTVDGEILESGHVIYDFPITFME